MECYYEYIEIPESGSKFTNRIFSESEVVEKIRSYLRPVAELIALLKNFERNS